MTCEINRLLDEQPAPVFVIADLSNVSMDLGDHLQASGISAREDNSLMHHPNVWESVFVGTDPMVAAAVKGLRSATFGMTRVSHFDTLDEALAYCYDQLGHRNAEAGASPDTRLPKDPTEALEG